MTRPILAVTMGDPAGIGPEIIVKSWTAARQGDRPFFVVGDHDLLGLVGQVDVRVEMRPLREKRGQQVGQKGDLVTA